MKFTRKIFTYTSNAALLAGSAISIYVLVKTYLLKASLPAGVCLVTDSRYWIYAALGLLAASLVLSFFEPKKKRPEHPAS